MYDYIIVARKGDILKNITCTINELNNMVHNLKVGGWIISHITVEVRR